MSCKTNDRGTAGQLLSSLLESKGWTQRTLAAVLQMGESTITRLVADRQVIDATLAILLEEVFAVPAEEFLSRQADRDLAQARRTTRPDRVRARRARLFGELPIAEMIRRGWIDAEDIRDLKAVEDALVRFFGACRPEDMEFPTPTTRNPGPTENVSPRQLAWLRRVEHISRTAPAGPYATASVDAALRKLKELLAELEAVARVPQTLAECGIRFVIVEPLAGTGIDGACLWLDDRAPVVAVSLRVDRIDSFWLVLRRQLEHVARGRNTPVLDMNLDRGEAGRDVTEDDRIACRAAHEFCVPAEALDSFLNRTAPIVSGYDMVEFARSLGIHPGILAGLIQRKTGGYDRFGVHVKKVRPIIAPHAYCDGWGQTVGGTFVR